MNQDFNYGYTNIAHDVPILPAFSNNHFCTRILWTSFAIIITAYSRSDEQWCRCWRTVGSFIILFSAWKSATKNPHEKLIALLNLAKPNHLNSFEWWKSNILPPLTAGPMRMNHTQQKRATKNVQEKYRYLIRFILMPHIIERVALAYGCKWRGTAFAQFVHRLGVEKLLLYWLFIITITEKRNRGVPVRRCAYCVGYFLHFRVFFSLVIQRKPSRFRDTCDIEREIKWVRAAQRCEMQVSVIRGFYFIIICLLFAFSFFMYYSGYDEEILCADEHIIPYTLFFDFNGKYMIFAAYSIFSTISPT